MKTKTISIREKRFLKDMQEFCRPHKTWEDLRQIAKRKRSRMNTVKKIEDKQLKEAQKKKRKQIAIELENDIRNLVTPFAFATGLKEGYEKGEDIGKALMYFDKAFHDMFGEIDNLVSRVRSAIENL